MKSAAKKATIHISSEHLAPTHTRNPTEFEERVYAAVKCIPPGKVASYGCMASYLGTSPRAIGGTMKRNPYAPDVPWHRVIASDGSIGGFSGKWGEGNDKTDKKRKLLRSEGVVFGENVYNDDNEVVQLGKVDVAISMIRQMSSQLDSSSLSTTSSRNITDNKHKKKTTGLPAALKGKAKFSSPVLTHSSESKKNINDLYPTDDHLKKVTMELVTQRGTCKTCWPSEIPRRIAKLRPVPSPACNWRDWMPRTHIIIKDLAAKDEILITQKGKVCKQLTDIRGPYRIRLA